MKRIFLAAMMLAASCVPGSVEDPSADLHLMAVEIIGGSGQSGIEGQPLAEPIVARILLSDGSVDLIHPLSARIVSGRGMLSLPGGGWVGGNGGTLVESGVFRVVWTLGPATDPQLLRFFTVGSDTLYADVSATVRPALAPTNAAPASRSRTQLMGSR